MFINTGGLPEQHRPSNGKLHLQRHHYAHRHLQQFGQHHLPCWSRRLAACRHSLCPDPCRHGSPSPSVLLLNGVGLPHHL